MDDTRVHVGIGWSQDTDARRAGVEAAQKALASSHQTEANVAFVFSTIGYAPEQLLAGIGEVLKSTPVHGGTSFTGVITPDGFLGGDRDAVAVMTMTTQYVDFGVGYAELGQDPEAAGRAAVEMAVKTARKQADIPAEVPDIVLMAASPGNEEAVMRGIMQVIGEDVPIIGGSVADNTVEGNWHVFAGQRAMSAGVVVTALFTHLPLGYSYASGYRPTNKKAIITKAAGRTVYELNGKKAIDVYADWIGQSPKDLAGMAILGASILKPVGVYNRENKFHLVKHPGVAQDDGSIFLFAEVKEGDELVLMEASVDDLINEVPEAIRAAMEMRQLEEEDIAALFLVHCGGRRGAIGDRIGEVVETINKTLNYSVPFVSYLTFGEQGCLPSGQNVHGDLLLSALVIGK